jgi:hypothetical protein
MTARKITTTQALGQTRPNTTAAYERARWCRKELAHIRCDHTTGAREGEDLHRGRKETEAESVAHLCCRALGLDTQVYSDAYVLGWANGDIDLVEERAETVLKVAKAILKDMTPAEASAPDETGAEDSITSRTAGRRRRTRGGGPGRRRTAGKRRATNSAGGQR